MATPLNLSPNFRAYRPTEMVEDKVGIKNLFAVAVGGGCALLALLASTALGGGLLPFDYALIYAVTAGLTRTFVDNPRFGLFYGLGKHQTQPSFFNQIMGGESAANSSTVAYPDHYGTLEGGKLDTVSVLKMTNHKIVDTATHLAIPIVVAAKVAALSFAFVADLGLTGGMATVAPWAVATVSALLVSLGALCVTSFVAPVIRTLALSVPATGMAVVDAARHISRSAGITKPKKVPAIPQV